MIDKTLSSNPNRTYTIKFTKFNFLKGDIDRNGVVDANDASLALELYKSDSETDIDILIGDLDLSIEVESFLSDVNWFKDDIALVFFIRDDDIIEMHFCHDSWNDFQPELTFTFKKTFDDDLFD